MRRELLSLDERDRGDRGPEFRRRMSLIELGAEQFYLSEARRARFSMVTCAIAYGIAVALIIRVISTQAYAVAQPAGWQWSP
jgi:hypothetical protein